MTAGELDRRVIIMRRSNSNPDDAGQVRGDFRPVFEVWAGYRPMSATKRTEYGYAEDVLTGWLKIRESSQVATLTDADRVVFKNADADEFAIDSVPLNDRSGYRLLRISRKIG